MQDPDPKRPSPSPRRSTGWWRRLTRDRISAIAAGAALIVVIGLVAIPLAVVHRPDPLKEPAFSETLGPIPVSEDAVDAVNAVLAPRVGDPSPDERAMASRLGQLGPEAIPVIIGMLSGSVPAAEFAHGTTDQPIHPAALACREQVLFASLKKFNSKDVVTFASRNAPFASLGEQLVFARVLGEQASLEAQDALLAMLAGVEPIQLQRDYVRGTFEQALGECLSSGPAALRNLSNAVAGLDPALLPTLARAVGRTRGQASSLFLAHLLERTPEVDVVALEELARVAESSGIELPEEQLAKVRRLVDSPDATLARSAISLLGRLCDRESFGRLVEHLEDQERLVSAAAHWSLRNMARMDLGATPEAWLSWHEQQNTWWEQDSPGLLEALRSSDASRVIAALNEWMRHPFFKHEAARAIGPLAVDRNLALASAAISALERIGSTQACDSLVQALQFDDARRAQACKALHTLTGLDLPAEYVRWSEALSDPR
jgi:HEAT repeat protein